jgi:HK97 family phage portal protein
MESVAEREDRIARLAGERAVRSSAGAEDRALTRASPPASMLGASSIPGARPVSVREALGLPDVQACVRAFAGVFAMVPLVAVRDGLEGPMRAREAPADRLLERPEDGVAAAAWRGRLGTHLAVHGEAFIGLARDGEGRIAALQLLDPAVVEVEIVAGRRQFQVPDALGQPRRLSTSDVLHVCGPVSLDGVRALGPIKSAPLAFALARSIGEHAVRTFSSGAKTQTIVSVKGQGPAADEVSDNLMRELKARPDGVVVVDGDVVDVQRLGASNVEADMIASARWASQLIARSMGLPASAVLGETVGDSATYVNAQSQLAALAGLHLRPYLEAVVGALALCDELFFGGLRPRWALEDAPLDPERGFGAAPATPNPEALRA